MKLIKTTREYSCIHNQLILKIMLVIGDVQTPTSKLNHFGPKGHTLITNQSKYSLKSADSKDDGLNLTLKVQTFKMPDLEMFIKIES